MAGKNICVLDIGLSLFIYLDQLLAHDIISAAYSITFILNLFLYIFLLKNTFKQSRMFSFIL